MNDAERQAAIDRLRDFAAQQTEAGDLADRNSIERAKDVVAVYEDRDENGRRKWSLEIDPPKARRHMGRPVDPESFSRFTKWLSEVKEVPLPGRRAYQLRAASEISTYLNSVQISPTSEGSLRPLAWMRKNGHEAAIADVWRNACDRAGGTPTVKEVREALTAWKHEHAPQQKRAATPKVTGPEAVRLEFERLARQLMEQDPEQFLLGFDHIEQIASQRFAKTKAAAA